MDLQTLLEVRDLRVGFGRENERRMAVDHVSYSLRRGMTLGLVGESGSGKSVSSMALMGLLPTGATCRVEGQALLRTRSRAVVDLLAMSERELRRYRGGAISMVFQEPMTSLNPMQRCGAQVVEMLRQHEKVGRREAKARVIALFEEVQLPRPEVIFRSYPHEISGGQKQRVMIAMALVCNPQLLIADEPTTALDVTVQRSILDLLKRLQLSRDLSVIFITHDLGVVAQVADEVAVMYKGSIVEQGSLESIVHHATHPYTRGLFACRPPLEGRPLLLPTVEDYMRDTSQQVPQQETSEQRTRRLEQMYASQPILSVRDLSVDYVLKRNLLGKPLQTMKAVQSVSFDLFQGETLGLVGESGCGKTSLGRALLQLLHVSSGSVSYRGQRLDAMSSSELRRLRTRLQIIFQDPYSSLNPRMTVGRAIEEPLQYHHLCVDAAERRKRVVELMEQVGLDEGCFDRYPHEFSGGQRQRVCIARALIVQPEVVVCDESVSALDVSVQSQVLNLLNTLKRRYGFAYLFVSHDLSVVRFLSDRILVMRNGVVVEQGDADALFAHPQHAYTQSLLGAIPRL